MASIKILVSIHSFVNNKLYIEKKCQSLVQTGENSNISVISAQFLAWFVNRILKC